MTCIHHKLQIRLWSNVYELIEMKYILSSFCKCIQWCGWVWLRREGRLKLTWKRLSSSSVWKIKTSCRFNRTNLCECTRCDRRLRPATRGSNVRKQFQSFSFENFDCPRRQAPPSGLNRSLGHGRLVGSKTAIGAIIGSASMVLKLSVCDVQNFADRGLRLGL